MNEHDWECVRRPDLPLPSSPIDIMLTSIEPGRGWENEVFLIGNTADGVSVVLRMTGFRHYFWADVPNGFGPGNVDALTDKLNDLFVQDRQFQKTRYGTAVVDERRRIHRITTEKKENVAFYKGEEAQMDYLKIEMETPKDAYEVRAMLKDLQRATGNPFQVGRGGLEMYEEKVVDYPLRCMIDKCMNGFCWIQVSNYRPDQTDTTASWTITADHADVVTKTDADGDEYGTTAPLRKVDFDIECYATTKSFPSPTRDPVIQIGVQIHDSGVGGDMCVADVVLVTGKTDPVDGTDIVQYDTEEGLLRGFAELLRASDYDISRTFNGRKFDWPYLFDRAEHLGCSDAFKELTRISSIPAHIKSNQFGKKGVATRAFRDAEIAGRTDFDICAIVVREEKLESYKLNSVSMAFLETTKEDVHHSMISKLYDGSNADRARLARYCRKDAQLCKLIDDKQLYLIRYVEQARVCRVTLKQLVQRGQQIKVVCQLLHLAREFGFILPLRKQLSSYIPDGKYEGAIVLDPIEGYHKDPVACMDFNSLYPSEVAAHNLCWTTCIRPEDVEKFPSDQVFRGPAGHAFVKRSVRRGLLCTLVERLLAARKVAKKDKARCYAKAKELADMGDVQGAREWERKGDVQDGRQIALKLSANSAYGFTGVSLEQGSLSMFEVAETITKCGQQDLLLVRQYLIDNVPGCKIVYGDTDSVMVAPGMKTVPAVFEWMYTMSDEINEKLFKDFPPMRLAPEKVMWPSLFLSKKRYVCGYYESTPDQPDKVYSRGLENVRRSSAAIVRDTLNACFHEVFINLDKQKAVEIARSVIEELYLGKVDMSRLLLSSTLSQPPEQYANTPPHVALTMKMRKRDPLSAPDVGDRVPYVMVGHDTSDLGACAEDPLYALENQLDINVKYYIENQLQKPLTRLFQPIIGERKTSDLFYGAHTRKRVRARVNPENAPRSSIMSFAVVKRACSECRTMYDPKGAHPSLCSTCVSEHGGLVKVKKQKVLDVAKEKYDAEFSVCQTCQGSDRDPVVCVAKDCPQLYRRKDAEFRYKRALRDIEDIASASVKRQRTE